MINKFRLAIVIAIVALAATVMTTTAMAKGHHDSDKPGWGFGDDNHHHTGPPGQSDRVDHDGDKDHGKKGDTDNDKVNKHDKDNDGDTDHGKNDD